MALINCPECGKENISEFANSCPECGFPIAKYFEDKKEVEKSLVNGLGCGTETMPDLESKERIDENIVKKPHKVSVKKIVVLAIVSVLAVAVGGGIFWGIKKNKPIEPGQTIKFGAFEQDDNLSNGSEPLEWIVLSIDSTEGSGLKALLLSKNAIYSMGYNEGINSGSYWNTSNIRKWISSNFYQNAFNEDEKSQIILTIIVLFSGYDVTNNLIEEKIKYEYLDLVCNYGEEVGSKTPIYLDNAGTRSFRIESINVIFADGSSCETDFSEAVSISCQENLSEKYDEYQISQFIRIFGPKSKFVPQKYDDLYFCACGCINKDSKCNSCGKNIDEMITIDAEALKNDGVYNLAISKISNKSITDNEEAIKLLETIIDWKDSRAKIAECNSKNEEINNAEAERMRRAEEARITAKKRNKKIAMIWFPGRNHSQGVLPLAKSWEFCNDLTNQPNDLF